MPGLWSIEEDLNVDKVYHVHVKTLDKFTTESLVKILKTEISSYRKKTVQHFLVQQRILSQELVEKKRSELNTGSLVENKKEAELITGKITELKSQLNLVRRDLHKTKSLKIPIACFSNSIS